MRAGQWGARPVGVDCTLFSQLVELSTRFQPKGRSLMLGRQGFKIEPPFAKHYEKALRFNGVNARRFDYLQDDQYSETLFQKLGFGKIETMDFASYEGPSIEQDLNEPVPKKLHRKFDFIFDGGTIEHVFNVPQALINVFNMLKPGGRFVSANGLNGWVGHGMYQFNPELVWTFWKRKCHCLVHRCMGIHKIPDKAKPLHFADAAETGKRVRLKGLIPDGRVYLYYEIEKTDAALDTSSALQSDYQVKWAGA
jgi:SAM-dependent methyltransferase